MLFRRVKKQLNQLERKLVTLHLLTSHDLGFINYLSLIVFVIDVHDKTLSKQIWRYMVMSRLPWCMI